MPTYTKDPDAVLDYKFDWSTWLASGETISSATVTVDAGITKDSDSITDTNTSVTAWLSGGTLGETYRAICHIVTSDSREEDQTITLKIKDK